MIYIVTFFALLLFSLTPRKYNKTVFYLCSLYLILMGGLRAQYIGTDTAGGYREYWELFNKGYDLNYVERSFRLLMGLVSRTGGGYQTLLFILEVLCVVPTVVVISRQKDFNYCLALFVYYGMALYLHSFNVIRQCVAMGFCLLSYDMFKDHKIWSLIFFILGVVFHKSAFVFIAAFIMLYVPLNLSGIIVLLLVSFIAGLVVSPSFFKVLPIPQSYLNYLTGDEGFRPKSIMIIVMALAMNAFYAVYVIFGNKKMLHDEYTKLLLLGICVLNVTQSLALGTRLMFYFTQSQIIFYPRYLRCLTKRQKVFWGLLLALYLAVTGGKIFIGYYKDITPYNLYFLSPV